MRPLALLLPALAGLLCAASAGKGGSQTRPRHPHPQAAGLRRELETFNAIVATITGTLELDAVLKNIVDAAQSLVPQAQGVTIQLLDAAAGRLITRAVSRSVPPGAPQIAFAPGEGVAGRVIQSRQVLNIHAVAGDDRFLPGRAAPPFASLLAAPLIFGETVLGTLSLEGAQTGAFGPEEERLVQLLAGQAAIAVENARLYDQRRRAEQALIKYSERLEEMVAERTAALQQAQERLLEQHRLEQELTVARQVQKSLLPRHTPEIPGYDFAATALPARYVSGDIYDFILTAEGACHIALADIGGKGIPAALLTSATRAALRAAVEHYPSPERILTHLNAHMYPDLDQAETIVTVFDACLYPAAGRLVYANAGHTQALWRQAARGTVVPLQVTGLPLGVLPDAAVEQAEVLLRPGDTLVFYSDGITEAENPDDGQYGHHRLREAVARWADFDPPDLVQHIIQSVEAFRRSAPRSDDITLIVLKALPRRIPFEFTAAVDHLEAISLFLRQLAQPYGDDFAYQVELIASELVTNIIRYAYELTPGPLTGGAHLLPDRLEVEFFDRGRAFDLSSQAAPDLSEPQEGGYGLFIARQLADTLDYASEPGRGNHWRFSKIAPALTNAADLSPEKEPL